MCNMVVVKHPHLGWAYARKAWAPQGSMYTTHMCPKLPAARRDVLWGVGLNWQWQSLSSPVCCVNNVNDLNISKYVLLFLINRGWKEVWCLACFFSSIILIRRMSGSCCRQKLMVWIYLLKYKWEWIGLKLMWASQKSGSHFCFKWEWLKQCKLVKVYKKDEFWWTNVFCQFSPCLQFKSSI